MTINTSLVPFEFTPITTDIEIILPQEIDAPMKDQNGEIMDQDNNSEIVSVQDIDKHSFLLRSIKNENFSKIDVGKLPQEIEVPINDQIDQDRNSETHSESKTKNGSCLASTENETRSIKNLHKPSNNSIISIEKSVHQEDKRNLTLMVVHGGGKKQFQCDFCEYTYTTKQNFNEHILAVHEGKKSFQCEMCEYASAHKQQLKRHILTVHEGKKPFKCELCEYASATKQRLKQHILTVHEGKKPFKCELCEYASAVSRDLKNHIQAVHEGKKPIKCEMCEYASATKQCLKQHILTVHEGKKPFQCELCEYAFAESRNLKKHIQAVHEGKKPFQCEMCEYASTHKQALNKHILVVHD
jgi:hemerythrin-like domain-containing protein